MGYHYFQHFLYICKEKKFRGFIFIYDNVLRTFWSFLFLMSHRQGMWKLLDISSENIFKWKNETKKFKNSRLSLNVNSVPFQMTDIIIVFEKYFL